ncbi:MAG: GAF domain-containing SpoIIE family protein phosphatase [Kofleriaceae bacterium]|nr:GAF domain-containing SpoIIE family protein phosphatase [Kofleriaceae bacterium]
MSDSHDERIRGLEQALLLRVKEARELRALAEGLSRELAHERGKHQSRLFGSEFATSLLAQHGNLERAAPQMLEAIGLELEFHVVRLLVLDAATQTMQCRFQWQAGAAPSLPTSYARGVGVPGEAWMDATPHWVPDLAAAPSFTGQRQACDAGLIATCAFPIVVDGEVHAIIDLWTNHLRKLDENLLLTLGGFGAQLGKAIEHMNRQEQARFNELQIARHIQTAILPRDLSVEGLEVSAMMVPATEVGGDYYDVLPFDGGAWFGIGDVTGHGVGAGMIMLMVQSAVAALIQDPTTQSPRNVTLQLNRFLHDNIRHRLREKDHVTFSLLRYTRDGVVRFAGAHEDIVIWRADRRRCEAVRTEGTWLGAVPSIDDVTREQQITLSPGDILVLYTDGLIEGRDATRELFGLHRLIAAVEQLASPTRTVAALCDAVLGQALRWCASQEDDISLVMARYHGDQGDESDFELLADHTLIHTDDL